ncbi:MAG: DUF2937 family protein [Steroidobacteraceae bacterium]
MAILRGILDRIVLVVAILVAGCAPSFVAQYRQRVSGRLDQVIADLQPFQQIADRLHGGSLQNLIQHHLASSDATFHAEGAAIQTMVNAEVSLRAMIRGLDADLVHQIGYLVANQDPVITRATWEIFQPGFALNTESLIFAVGCGVLIWLLFLGIWAGVAWLWRAAVASAEPRPPQPRRMPTIR